MNVIEGEQSEESTLAKAAEKVPPLHVCKICKKHFKHRQSLFKHHKTRNLDDVKIECKKCLTIFSREDALTRHINNNHCKGPNKEHKCEQCLKIFARKEHLQKDLFTHTKEKYECNSCGKTYGRQDQFYADQRSYCDMVKIVLPQKFKKL